MEMFIAMICTRLKANKLLLGARFVVVVVLDAMQTNCWSLRPVRYLSASLTQIYKS